MERKALPPLFLFKHLRVFVGFFYVIGHVFLHHTEDIGLVRLKKKTFIETNPFIASTKFEARRRLEQAGKEAIRPSVVDLSPPAS